MAWAASCAKVEPPLRLAVCVVVSGRVKRLREGCQYANLVRLDRDTREDIPVHDLDQPLVVRKVAVDDVGDGS